MFPLHRPILSRLQTGTVSIENNIDKIFEYLRIMSSHRATSAVIPPVALRRLLVKIENRMRSNPRLRLPYDPRAAEIWKYYSVIKITPIVDGQNVGHINDHTSFG